MIRFARAFVLVITLLAASFSFSSTSTTAHDTTHTLSIGPGKCSSTAVGPHALLTATHCLSATDSVAVDGTPAKIVEVESDSADHSILLVTGISFEHFAAFSKTGVAQGDEVFIFGNPGTFVDMFRKGYVSGTGIQYGLAIALYDLNGFFGDSGAAIFNADGKIAAVTSFVYVQSSGSVTQKFMGSYELRLTDRQKHYAETF